jgi:prevent-host-death family protein
VIPENTQGRGGAAVSKRLYTGVEEARQNLPSLLADANSGKPVVITKHGKPYAAIVPLESLPDARKGPSVHALRGSGAGLYGDDAAAWIDRMRDEW